MSVTEQVSGPISTDEGYRSADRMAEPVDETSRVLDRARATDQEENLGYWGAEDWFLPGQEETGPRCGEYRAEGVCEAGHVEWGIHQCGRRSCPNCWASQWANDAAARGTIRLQSFRYTQPDDYHRQAGHASVSPEKGEIMNARQYWNGRARAAEIAREKGFRGFAVIPHPGRLTDLGDRYYHVDVDRDEDGDPLCGKWVWLRKDVDGEFPDWLEAGLVEWSPHYHIIGMMSPDMEPGNESDEWVYDFHGSFERFDGIRDRDSHEKVYGRFRYLLSHTGYPKGSSKQVVTWYGCLANSVYVEEATEDWQYQKPSPGVMSALEREVEEAVEITLEEEGDGQGDEQEEICDHDGCTEQVIDVWDIPRYLETRKPPPDVTERMEAVRDWRGGRIRPPPGLQRPTSLEEAEETLEVLLE